MLAFGYRREAMDKRYPELHDKLMDRWSRGNLHQGRQFCRDGIIDPIRWEAADRKILLLLKEAYDCDDLCLTIRDEWQGPRYNIWWTASYWLYALRKCTGTFFPTFPKSDSEFKQCSEYLLSAAAVNVKKSDGASASSNEDLAKYVKEDHQLIQEQINLIQPDIVLCGYTFEYYKDIMGSNTSPIGQAGYIHSANGRIIFDWWHPAQKYPNEIWYYALCAAIIDAKLFA